MSVSVGMGCVGMNDAHSQKNKEREKLEYARKVGLPVSSGGKMGTQVTFPHRGAAITRDYDGSVHSVSTGTGELNQQTHTREEVELKAKQVILNEDFRKQTGHYPFKK